MILYRQFVLREKKHAQALWAFLKNNWREMAKQEKPLVITCEEYKAKRTIDQNKRLHVILDAIAAQTWISGKQYSAEAWKEYYRKTFIGTEEIELPDGTLQERGLSTTILSVSEFTDFMTKIEAHAIGELGIDLYAIH